MIGGLTWPEDGNPCFVCLLQRKLQKTEETLEQPTSLVEIVKELEFPGLLQMLEALFKESKIDALYAPMDIKYASFVSDFNRWRREHLPSLHLKAARISSFEAGILKIREMLSEKNLKFQDDSIVKSQLRIFSKTSLKNEKDFYAVSALTNVISVFKTPHHSIESKSPRLSAWY